MKALRRVWGRLTAALLRRNHEQELSDEIASHIAMQTEDNLRSGMDPETARREALLKFGGMEGVKEVWRDQHGLPWIEGLCADIRYAVRGLRRNPGFTTTAVWTLALGIGANVAIFSVVYSVLLRPLPYPDAERLVRIYSTNVETGRRSGGASIPAFLDWKQRAASFDAMEGLLPGRAAFVDGNPDQPIWMLFATPEFFDLMGARPRIGRLIEAEDLRADAPSVVLLAHEFWMSRFGGDPGVVGQSIRLGQARTVVAEGIFTQEMDDAVYTVIGVLEPVHGPLAAGRAGPAEVISPGIIETSEYRNLWNFGVLSVVARLGAGVSLADAQQELDRIGADLLHHYSENARTTPVAVPLHEVTASAARPALLALQGATGLILLIAISNIANLLLVRGSARGPEFSVRIALGASRLRLARLLLTESLLLSFLGAIGGMVLGYAAMRGLVLLQPAWIPGAVDVGIDTTVIGVTLAVTLIAGILFGLLPVLFLHGAPMLKGKQALGESGGVGWLRSGLVVTQITLSLVLLTGSGLIIRSFLALKSVPIGIDYEQVVTFSLGNDGFTLGPSGAARTVRLQQYREALTYVQAIPGIHDATVTSQPPLTTSYGSTGVEVLSGAKAGEEHNADLVGVAENFFQFMGSHAVAGRLFESADVRRADSLVVVDANLAGILWPGESAVGRLIRLGQVESEVIGVVEPIRYGDLRADMRPKLFHLLNRSGMAMFGGTFLVRHDGSPIAILSAIEARLKEAGVEFSQPLSPRPLAELYDQYLREPRFHLLLLGSLGALALAVAAVGVYGVVAYAVTRRTGEIGIRVALGATRRHIAGLFCRHIILLLIVGLGAGAAGAVWLTRYIESLLFGVEPVDPPTMLAVAALLTAAALAATWIPVRRALRVDPAATLRSE